MNLITDSELNILNHKDCVKFALFCAKQVENQWKDKPACVEAITTVEAWLEGKATAEACKKAANSAYSAASSAYSAANSAYYAATYAANSAANFAANSAASAASAANFAANSAAYAANSAAYAAKKQAIAEQWEYYYSLLGELGKVLYL